MARGTRTARARRARWAALGVCALLLWAGPTWAAGGSPEDVKARFVFLLFKYVTWPESAVPANAPFVVGVVGDPAFADAFKRIVAESPSQGHPIDVRTLADGAEATGIHLLYVGGEDPAALRKLAHDYHGEPVLTVADRFEFPDLGGDIGLEMSGDRVTFSISRRKSERGDFVISSKLMRLASEVK